ncbi:MAG: hypothetical protein L0H29_05655 [Sinobacteraceae bacterium]|nr:hypothetical protein [Nevskiaceae bacterium]
MSAATLSVLVLMLALGVRHGLDPEHVAIVNGVTLRAVEQKRRWPVACGAWFALGHGLVITAIAAGFVSLLGVVKLPPWVIAVGEWLPVLILLAVAVVNLNELLRNRLDYRPVAVKNRLLPRALGDSSSPVAVFLIGMAFAPFVDPATQAAVWAYVVTVTGGLLWIVLLGSLLTLSMAVTCMLEARAVVYLMQAVDGERAARRRRIVGWVIVVFSFAVVGYALADAVCAPGLFWLWRVLAAAGITALLGFVCTAALWRWAPKRPA